MGQGMKAIRKMKQIRNHVAWDVYTLSVIFNCKAPLIFKQYFLDNKHSGGYRNRLDSFIICSFIEKINSGNNIYRCFLCPCLARELN